MVVGGGTVGAWCAYFLRRAGLERVVLLEKGALGQGASSRAAGVVRTQGGTEEAVRLGLWSREFYLGQRDEIGTDSGFVEQGYLLPCFTEADVAAARERMAMQSALGVPVHWLGPDEVDSINPTLAPGLTLGGTFCAVDGYITPTRNVAAYTVALIRSGVEIAEHVEFVGLARSRGMVSGVETIVGAQSDPLYGPMLLIGSGGILVELVRDAAMRLLPVSAADVSTMIDGLKVNRLLAGYRGKPPADRKALDIVALDLRGILGYADYFVIASGRTDRQTKAIHDAIHAGMKSRYGMLPRRVEGLTEGRWILMDYLDVVVHVFTPETREYYRLEQLWGEAPSVAVG